MELFLLQPLFQLISGMTTIYPMAEHTYFNPSKLRGMEYVQTVQPRRMQYIHNAFCAVQIQSLLFPYGAKSRAVGSAGPASLLVHMAEGSGMGVSCGTDYPKHVNPNLQDPHL